MDDFERAVVAALLAPETVVAPALRAQAACAAVERRERDRGGLRVYFRVPAGAPRIAPPDLAVGGDVEVSGLRGAAYAELTVRGGALQALAVSSSTEEWPERPVLVRAALAPSP